MRSILKAWPFALAPLLGACMTMVDSRISASAVRPGQRTAVIVYPSPSPWVIANPDSKAESAAKTMPGLSFVVSSFQEDRSLKESADLKLYLPRWRPDQKLLPYMMEELSKSGFSGVFLTTAQAEIPEERLRQLNRSTDILGWQKSYFDEAEGRSFARNYGSMLHLDDALIFEVNLLYGVNGNDDGNMVPTLSASSRLLHANTLHPIWRHEDMVEDPASARSLYEFKTLPRQLLDLWEKLMPQLAAKISASLRASMDAPLPYAPPPPPQPLPALPSVPPAPSAPPPAISASSPTATVAISSPTVSVSSPTVSVSSPTAPSNP